MISKNRRKARLRLRDMGMGIERPVSRKRGGLRVRSGLARLVGLYIWNGAFVIAFPRRGAERKGAQQKRARTTTF